ncbi:MAG: 3-methyl-2-oxobutanoate hydroxymethyltransferase [Micavibrio sp.]|nr:3-methyl-2-oxobutanoate hydroxymethyltransferase [Micavibrio sp.]
MRKTVQNIKSAKNKTPLVCLTAYTAPMANIADQHCDLILVGDSLSMVLYGENSTQNANIEMMVRHGRAVIKSSKNAVIVVDMPFGSYENSPEEALKNAQTIINETGACAVKLEGGENIKDTIKLLTNSDIPVMGHIGLLPQSVNSPDGFKVQGREQDQAEQLMKDAKAVEQAGAFSFVIEAVPEPLAAVITASVSIPAIGIGASAACDGQILVTEDMLGLSVGRKPKFVKAYADLNKNIDNALSQYAKDVQERSFPAEENTYKNKNAA